MSGNKHTSTCICNGRCGHGNLLGGAKHPIAPDLINVWCCHGTNQTSSNAHISYVQFALVLLLERLQ